MFGSAGLSFDSVLIDGDEIEEIGDFTDYKSSGFEIFDYGDSVILPGFTDAHLHLVWLGKILSGCDLREIKTSSELVNKIKEFSDGLDDDDFLLGYGYNEHEWEDGVKPTCDLIDNVSGNHPAILTRSDGHSWLLNSKMMVLAGIHEIKDPELRKHIQYLDGKPTGIVFDNVFTEKIKPLMPDPSPLKTRESILLAQEHLLSLGITSCRTFGTLDDFLMLASLEQENLLKLRIAASIPDTALDWAITLATQTGSGTERFWLGQIKIFSDGSLGSKTALVSKPYSDGTYGLPVMPFEKMQEIVDKAHAYGFGVAIHAIGDVAVHNVVKVLKNGTKKDSIEHFQCASTASINEIAKTEVNVVLNPSHMPVDFDFINTEWKELKNMVYPVRSLKTAGVKIGFGSDAPVVTANPFYAIACATTRKGINTGKINPSEAIPFNTAMKIAFNDSSEIIGGPKRGSIEKGYKADLIVTDDFIGKNPWDVLKTSVNATFVGGEKVWEK
ncbi:MAG: amidohydrolase [Caldisericia bacterium]